jgi:ABC-type multidrug transport system ATPase subunit
VNILCLDECLDGLDSEGRQRVVDLLQSLRKERESIFLISHDPDLAETFERTLIVVKENGVSRLERAM